MRAIISSIDEEFQKSERMLRPIGAVGHKAYTRVRRGKLESIKQAGDVGKKEQPAQKKPFGDYISEQLKTVRSNIIKNWESDLKSVGIADLKVNDERPWHGVDMYGVEISGKYAGKPVKIKSSHQGNTMYFNFAGGEEQSAMSAATMKTKMDKILKK